MSAKLLFAMLKAFDDVPAEALPPPHRLILLVLADRASEHGEAWPSAATMAKRTGQGARTVETCLAELEAAGWIEGARRHQGGRPLSTVYTVHLKGRPVARKRPGDHKRKALDTAPGRVSNEAPSTPRPARCHTALSMASDTAPSAEYTAPSAEYTAPSAEDPIRDPPRSYPPKRESSARAGEGMHTAFDLDAREALPPPAATTTPGQAHPTPEAGEGADPWELSPAGDLDAPIAPWPGDTPRITPPGAPRDTAEKPDDTGGKSPAESATKSSDFGGKSGSKSSPRRHPGDTPETGGQPPGGLDLVKLAAELAGEEAQRAAQTGQEPRGIGTSTCARLAAGRPLTPGQRAALGKIGLKRQSGPGPAKGSIDRRPAISLQQPAGPGEHCWPQPVEFNF